MKEKLAALSLIFAMILVTVNMFLPPSGKVDESAIYIFAQLLLFSATLLGVDAVIEKRLKGDPPPLPPPV